MNEKKSTFAERVERMQTAAEYLRQIGNTLAQVGRIVDEEAASMQDAAARFAQRKSGSDRITN
jgi:hypothetical protein